MNLAEIKDSEAIDDAAYYLLNKFENALESASIALYPEGLSPGQGLDIEKCILEIFIEKYRRSRNFNPASLPI